MSSLTLETKAGAGDWIPRNKDLYCQHIAPFNLGMDESKARAGSSVIQRDPWDWNVNVVRALAGVSDIKTNKPKNQKPKPAFWMDCSRDREAPWETMGLSRNLQSCWPMLTHAELAVQACLSQHMGDAILPQLSEGPGFVFSLSNPCLSPRASERAGKKLGYRTQCPSVPLCSFTQCIPDASHESDSPI